MSEQNPYAKFNKDELILRDYLAADRTELANETTFLAYVRTTFALFLVGVSILHFFRSSLGIISGLLFIFSSILVLLIGYRKFKTMERRIRSIQNVSKAIINDNDNIDQRAKKLITSVV